MISARTATSMKLRSALHEVVSLNYVFKTQEKKHIGKVSHFLFEDTKHFMSTKILVTVTKSLGTFKKCFLGLN